VLIKTCFVITCLTCVLTNCSVPLLHTAHYTHNILSQGLSPRKSDIGIGQCCIDNDGFQMPAALSRDAMRRRSLPAAISSHTSQAATPSKAEPFTCAASPIAPIATTNQHTPAAAAAASSSNNNVTPPYGTSGSVVGTSSMMSSASSASEYSYYYYGYISTAYFVYSVCTCVASAHLQYLVILRMLHLHCMLIVSVTYTCMSLHYVCVCCVYTYNSEIRVCNTK
jgi:hypothetical protein